MVQTLSSLPLLNSPVITKVADGFSFSEGPVWHPDQYFLFSDTPANCIYQVYTDKNLRVFLENSGLTHENRSQLSHQVGSNGLALDKQNKLVICQHGNHGIALLNDKKQLSILVSEYNGRPFNSPNDITLKSDGTIYFTDPPYGLAGEVLHPESFQPHAGIYKYDYKTVTLLGTELQYPNGLCFSPNEEYLYVGTNHPDEKRILQYAVRADGTLQYAGVFIEENADGMTIDKSGNVYLAAKDGIIIVSPQGTKLGLIPLPETPTNLSWGGAHGELLLVTTGNSVYFVHSR